MARTIGALCTFIVGLQILVGVPLAVCAVFFGCMSGGFGPFNVEVHTGHGQAPQFVVHGATIPPPPSPFALTPPPNAIPVVPANSLDNPILASRAQHGSPLAGTVLESADPGEEHSTFVAALEKAAVEHLSHSPTSAAPSATTCPAANEPGPSCQMDDSDRHIIRHLYAMADLDEQAGEFFRADQWRAFVREIRAEKSGELTSPPTLKTALDEPSAGE